MKKKLIVSLLLIILGILLYSFKTQDQTDLVINFYDKTFLRNSALVNKVLKDMGFFEVDYTTDDNLKINAIMLDQHATKKIETTIISMPGFVPGNKEGMTTLHAMLQEQPYNFIFIDSRGHGKSEGQLLTYQGIQEYGLSQYLDIVATVKFMYNYNLENNIEQNFIIHGLCSGAFHTIKAVVHLKHHNPEMYHAIKGIVLDSAWPSISSIVPTVLRSEATERCNTYCVPFLQPLAAATLLTFYNTCFKKYHDQQTPVIAIIAEIEQPILFIHAEHDQFIPVNLVYPLIENSAQAKTWFVKNATHVNSHLQYKDEYTEKLLDFIQTTCS